ncbi:MAG: FMN-binding protein [Candidatus Dadabacteria bacterium]|nr:FMN-binding protein [Candidatus Dadabacteria bacterium]
MKKLILIITIFIILPQSFLSASVFNTREKSLKHAFPNASKIDKIQIFLSDEQVDEIKKLGKTDVDSKIHIFYKAVKDGEEIGYAIIDTHNLRTTTETVLFVLNCDGTLRYAEILAFFEPQDYMPGNKWIDIFKNISLNDKIRVGRDIPDITGATITSNSFSEATRKVLAIYEVAVKNSH